MKNSYLLLAVAIVLSFSLITGCGGEKKAPVEQKNEEAEKAPVTEVIPEKTKKVMPEETKKTPAETAEPKEAVRAVTEKTTPALAAKTAEPVKAAVSAAAPVASKETIRLGSAIFKAKCVACHGTNGKGSPMAPAFTGSDWVKKTDISGISSVIKNGRSGNAKKYKKFPIPMPAHSTMPDKEVLALAHYIKSLN